MTLSIVIPVFNEAESIGPLVEEVVESLQSTGEFEIIVVDDASSDATDARLRALQQFLPHLRVLRHRTNQGQSVAILSGVLSANGEWVATLDGDGQNVPADILKLLSERDSPEAPHKLQLVAGIRRQRQDSVLKKWSSRVANAVRSRVLQDSFPDAGCGLKLFRRNAYLDLPRFDHMHRFLPALFKRQGGVVVGVVVGHRPRITGVSKYGTWDRLWVGVIDLFGMMWLLRRPCNPKLDK